MKLGITPWKPRERSAAGLTGQARQAEALGFHSFWLPESHFAADAIPEPLMPLAAVAAGTSRLKLGTTSFLLPLRNPLQAAEQVAVLDQLSNGRVILGVGRGYAPRMLKAFAVDPRDKRSLFQSSLERMILAWSGIPLPVDGLAGDAITLDPLPVQKPHPPVWVAAFGPKALTQAGHLGLPYLASPVEPLEVLARNYQRHRAAARDCGRPEPVDVPVMRALFLTDDARETALVRDAVREQARAAGRLPEGTAVEDWSIVGEASYLRERVEEYRQRLGLTHLIVARLRIRGLEDARVTRSVARAVEILGS